MWRVMVPCRAADRKAGRRAEGAGRRQREEERFTAIASSSTGAAVNTEQQHSHKPEPVNILALDKSKVVQLYLQITDFTGLQNCP